MELDIFPRNGESGVQLVENGSCKGSCCSERPGDLQGRVIREEETCGRRHDLDFPSSAGRMRATIDQRSTHLINVGHLLRKGPTGEK